MTKIKCSALSDTHMQHEYADLPGGDILIHAGDLTWLGQPKEVYEVLDWLADQPYKHKIFIAGNHDFGFEPLDYGRKQRVIKFRGRDLYKALDKDYKQYAEDLGLIYLHNELVEIEGLRIYGSPYQPAFFDWAFNYAHEGEFAKELWDKIPENIDILITHSPPLGVLDKVLDRNRLIDMRQGCPLLRKAVQKKKPRIHIFGHIHEGYGAKQWKHTLFMNVAFCQRDYVTFNGHYDFEVDNRR